MTAQFLEVRGKIEREGLVIHVIANQLIDPTHELRALGAGRGAVAETGEGAPRRLMETQEPGFSLKAVLTRGAPMIHEATRSNAPANRYARETGSSRTLGDLVRAKMALIAVCRHCRHRRTIFPAIELRQRLRCTGCRARVANLHESPRARPTWCTAWRL